MVSKRYVWKNDIFQCGWCGIFAIALSEVFDLPIYQLGYGAHYCCLTKDGRYVDSQGIGQYMQLGKEKKGYFPHERAPEPWNNLPVEFLRMDRSDVINLWKRWSPEKEYRAKLGKAKRILRRDERFADLRKERR